MSRRGVRGYEDKFLSIIKSVLKLKATHTNKLLFYLYMLVCTFLSIPLDVYL